MQFGRFTFGSVEVDGKTFEHDLVIDRGRVRRRRNGHTPLSLAEDIPWKCRRLVVGSGADGALPVIKEVVEEAERRRVKLVVLPTAQALEELRGTGRDTNAILHVTC